MESGLPRPSSTLSCVLVEDQRMFAQLLVGMLRTHEGLEVVASVGTAAEGIEACLRHRPDLLILDLCLPDQSGEIVAETLALIKPQARLIVLSAQASSFVCPAGLQPLLHAVIDKIEAYDTLGTEVSELLQASPASTHAKLTTRETELLHLLGRGLSNNQIAEVLTISVHTVETHRRNLSSKLGLKGAELIRYATLKLLQAP